MITGIIKNGKFKADDPDEFRDAFNFKDGTEIEVEVRKKNKKRSIKLNKYYFGCIVKEFSDVTGYTTNEAHEILKFQFLKGIKVDETTGLMMEYARSTTEMNNQQFIDYCEQCRIFLNTIFYCNIPLPNEER